MAASFGSAVGFLITMGFVLSLANSGACVDAAGAIISENPLTLDMSAEAVVSLKLPSDTMSFTAKRPSSLCLTEQEEENTASFSYTSGCNTHFRWNIKQFHPSNKIQLVLTEEDVRLSFGNEVTLNGNKITEKCAFKPEKKEDFYIVNFKILSPAETPRCALSIVFDDDIEIYHEPEEGGVFSSSLWMWVVGGVILLIVIIAYVVAVIFWNKQLKNKEKSNPKREAQMELSEKTTPPSAATGTMKINEIITYDQKGHVVNREPYKYNK